MFRQRWTYVSTKIKYVLTVLDLCFDFLDLSFHQNRACFDSLDGNRVCFDLVLNLKLLLERGISVAELKMLDFQSRNIANRRLEKK